MFYGWGVIVLFFGLLFDFFMVMVMDSKCLYVVG